MKVAAMVAFLAFLALSIATAAADQASCDADTSDLLGCSLHGPGADEVDDGTELTAFVQTRTKEKYTGTRTAPIPVGHIADEAEGSTARLDRTRSSGSSTHSSNITNLAGWWVDMDLLQKALEEEHLPPATQHPQEPWLVKWPRSYVNAIADLRQSKTRRFNFIGRMQDGPHSKYHGRRNWVRPFARDHFSKRDFFRQSDIGLTEASLGDFDHSNESWEFTPDRLSRKNYKPRPAIFDNGRKPYFDILAQSQFTLCPGGDQPWSYRFLEAILARSIPIVDNEVFANAERRKDGMPAVSSANIGWHFYLKDSPVDWASAYNETMVEENYANALVHHTLMGADSGFPHA